MRISVSNRCSRFLRVLCLVAGFAACLAGANLRAQDQEVADQPLNLTIWIVRPPTAAEHTAQRMQRSLDEIKQYRETTAGNFGTSAGAVGQTAGSYGKPAGELGKPASQAGQTAGSYGQPASSLPSNVKSQTAGSYGQTAGTFGTAASDYTGAPKPAPAQTVEDVSSRTAKGAAWTRFAAALHNRFEFRVVEVSTQDLQARLAAVAGTPLYPDVLLSDRMPEWWSASVEHSLTVLRLGYGRRMNVFTEPLPTNPSRREHPYIYAFGMVQARHPESVRAFLDWWFPDTNFWPSRVEDDGEIKPAEKVAQEAVSAVLSGGGLDALADPAMARFDPDRAVGEAFNVGAENVPDDLDIAVTVHESADNGLFAVVALSADCVSRKAYGTVTPVVFLRKDEHDRWRVLQMFLSVRYTDINKLFEMLQPYDSDGKPRDAVGTPALASPPDGDQREMRAGLRLAWDNNGDDGLLLLEWQRGKPGEGPASSIELLDDQHARGRTEIAAPFANVPGPVRWRVWALGRGGMIKLSDWRTVTMVP